MATSYVASNYFTTGSDLLNDVTLGDDDNTVEGGAVMWVLGTAVTAARSLIVQKYDAGRHGEYDHKRKPHILIKSAVATNVNNVTVEYPSGTTLYTFAADNSVTPAYCILSLTDAGNWELA